MQSYVFIQDPQFSALRRISPGEVPALFCVREIDAPTLPSRRARLLARVKTHLPSWPAARRAAASRTAP